MRDAKFNISQAYTNNDKIRTLHHAQGDEEVNGRVAHG
jgi:hypothetical protein